MVYGSRWLAQVGERSNKTKPKRKKKRGGGPDGGSHTIVIKPKKDGEQQGERDGQEDILHTDIPKVNEPPPVRGRQEGRARGEVLEVDAGHPPDVHEAGEEDDGERGAVVLDEGAHIVVEQGAAAQLAAEVGDGEDEDGDEDAQVEGLVVAEEDEDLDALLEVDEGDVEAEDVAGEAGDVAQPVARVGDGEDPVHDHGPEADPGHEGEVVGARGLHDVVDGVVEDGDGARDADDDQGLAGEEGEDDGAQDGGEEDLVHAVVGVRAGEHVQGEGQGREDAISACQCVW